VTEERVYVIGSPGSSTVKIGRTVDLKKRSTPGGHELEMHLHRRFRPSRSHGEWTA
jgi:hypothetical protein